MSSRAPTAAGTRSWERGVFRGVCSLTLGALPGRRAGDAAGRRALAAPGRGARPRMPAHARAQLPRGTALWRDGCAPGACVSSAWTATRTCKRQQGWRIARSSHPCRQGSGRTSKDRWAACRLEALQESVGGAEPLIDRIRALRDQQTPLYTCGWAVSAGLGCRLDTFLSSAHATNVACLPGTHGEPGSVLQPPACGDAEVQ